MNGSELNKINIIKFFKKELKDNLFAVVSMGSVASGNYKKLWSDIDALLVVENIDSRTKTKIAKVIGILENKYKKHFGIDVITKQEAQKPLFPSFSFEGKILQALLDLKKFPERLIFCKDKRQCEFYCPDSETIKQYSLSNVAMFLLRNRRNIIRKIPLDFEEYKKMVAKEIRASFIMTKLAIQYFNCYNCENNRETIIKAKEMFKNFNFSILEKNLTIINKWSNIKKSQQMDNIFHLTNDFIEEFGHYVLEKASK